MKKGITVLLFFMTLAFGIPAAYAAETPKSVSFDGTVEAVELEGKEAQGAAEQTGAYGVTIVFDKNGGQGSMDNLTLSDGAVHLSKNTFTRTGFTFTGWNT